MIIENPVIYVPIRHLSSVLCLLSSVLTSTTVEDSLQIDLFMQNKPKVKYAQINVSSFITSKYVKVDNWCNQKNKPKQSQNKANLVRRRRIANVYDTMNYENKSNWTLGQNKPNSKPIKPKTNPILSAVGGLQMSIIQ